MDSGTNSLRILFVTPDLSENSLGRTYCLWLLAKSQDWDPTVVSLRGEQLWLPLRSSEMGADCVRVRSAREFDEYVAAGHFDVIIGVKALPESALHASRAAKLSGVPLLLDIDDPDIEAQLSWGSPIKRIAKEILRPARQRRFRELRSIALDTPSIVSNPGLQDTYGGTVIPHVRRDPGAREASTNPMIEVSFVGTNRPHKGLSVLRKAVSTLVGEGFSLTITDNRPHNARPWERWVGPTSLEEGLEIVKRSDVAVVPSRRTPFAKAQLPVKIIDAMLVGTPVIASRVGPIEWELDGTGVLVRPGSWRQLRSALLSLKEVSVREALGASAREAALKRYLVEAQAMTFGSVVRSALGVARTAENNPSSQVTG